MEERVRLGGPYYIDPEGKGLVCFSLGYRRRYSGNKGVLRSILGKRYRID